eukprot:scaffold17384_cov48-Phaeocystis_antarctica.AAC.3
MPSPPSPPASAPWPRGTAAQPPRRAPSWRALRRGRGTPRAYRASAQWPRGRPWLLCACPVENGTACHQPSASRTHRPNERRVGPAPPRSRAAAAASPLHPPSSSETPSLPCDTPRAASRRQGSPGS